MNIYEEIRKDHDNQRELLAKLVETSGDTKVRYSLFKKLKEQLEIHADAEERHFYKPLLDNDMMQQKARHGIAEHHEIDELVEALEDTEQDSSAWLKIAKKLKDKVEHHLEDEEKEFFQLSGRVFTDDEKESYAKKYRKHMSENVEHP